MYGCDRAIGRDTLEETRPPGWCYLGREFTLLEPAGYPRDPAVTRAIREFDPTAVPLTVRMCYLSPADEAGERYVRVFTRHALGRYDPFKRPDDRLKALEVPPGYRGPIPNILERSSFCYARTERPLDLPGDYVPWDWPVYLELKESYWRSNRSVESMMREEQELLDARKAALDSEADSFAHDFSQWERWAMRQLDKASDVETRYAMKHGIRAVLPEPEKKPVVFLSH